MSATETKPRVENIVASTQFAKELDLYAVAEKLVGAEYEPTSFPGLVYRVRDPNVVCLLFGSGKMVITGAKNEGDIERAVDGVVHAIRESGIL